jgi:DNA-binding SARP family transcriptional activator/DNA-binding beta-propeller fold protein YncE
MRFGILGPLEVHDGTTPVSLGGGHQRKLLVLLLLHPNGPVSSDRLIDELWGGRPPETAAKALQGLVSQLRKQLGAATVETVPGGYLLRLDDGDLDARRFERLFHEARGLERNKALATLREALALWRGPALADFAYDDFARSEIERLEELRETCIERRIHLELALGPSEDLVPELEALVRGHPLRERLRYLLMLALYRAGRQADALEAYSDARRTLRDELGLEPGEELQELQKAILAHDPALDAPPRPAEPARGRRPRRALPLIAAGVLVVAGALVAVILLTRGSKSGDVAVPPDSVARVDPKHMQVASYVGVGRRPVALAIGAGGVWVANADDGTVNELDPHTGKLEHTIGVGTDINDLAIGFDSVWVADGNDGTVTRIDPTTAEIQRTLQLAAPDALGPSTVFFVAADDRYVWATLADRVLRIDPATNRVTGRVAVGAPTSLETGGGSVWVTTLAERLIRIDPGSLKVTASVDLDNPAFSASFGEDALWLVHGYPRIDRIDPVTLSVASAATALMFVTVVAAGSGSVWVGNPKGAVQQIDAKTGKVIGTVRVLSAVSAIAVDKDAAWIAVTRAS